MATLGDNLEGLTTMIFLVSFRNLAETSYVIGRCFAHSLAKVENTGICLTLLVELREQEIRGGIWELFLGGARSKSSLFLRTLLPRIVWTISNSLKAPSNLQPPRSPTSNLQTELLKPSKLFKPTNSGNLRPLDLLMENCIWSSYGGLMIIFAFLYSLPSGKPLLNTFLCRLIRQDKSQAKGQKLRPRIQIMLSQNKRNVKSLDFKETGLRVANADTTIISWRLLVSFPASFASKSWLCAIRESVDILDVIATSLNRQVSLYISMFQGYTYVHLPQQQWDPTMPCLIIFTD